MAVITESVVKTSLRHRLIQALIALLSRLQAFLARFLPPSHPIDPDDTPLPETEPVDSQPVPIPAEHLGSLIARRDLPEPLLPLAQGGVFGFRVYVCLTWISERLDEFAVENGIEQHTLWIHTQVREYAREIAGAHPPHHVAEVQAGINERLRAGFEPFSIGVGVLTCQARIRVAPDDKLRDRLAAHTERLIDVENEHQLRVQRAKLMHGLANEWLAMLDLLREHPMTAHANRLTDKNFADVIANMTEKRGDKTERLIRLLIPENGKGQGRNTSVGSDPD